jgi:hypothetical protein
MHISDSCSHNAEKGTRYLAGLLQHHTKALHHPLEFNSLVIPTRCTRYIGDVVMSGLAIIGRAVGTTCSRQFTIPLAVQGPCLTPCYSRAVTLQGISSHRVAYEDSNDKI